MRLGQSPQECFTRLPAQILLYESRAGMNVHVEERAIPDDFEAVNLAGLDDENVPSATFKRLSVHDLFHLRVCKYKP
jgi:hypothetical protein